MPKSRKSVFSLYQAHTLLEKMKHSVLYERQRDKTSRTKNNTGVVLVEKVLYLLLGEKRQNTCSTVQYPVYTPMKYFVYQLYEAHRRQTSFCATQTTIVVATNTYTEIMSGRQSVSPVSCDLCLFMIRKPRV